MGPLTTQTRQVSQTKKQVDHQAELRKRSATMRSVRLKGFAGSVRFWILNDRHTFLSPIRRFESGTVNKVSDRTQLNEGGCHSSIDLKSWHPTLDFALQPRRDPPGSRRGGLCVRSLVHNLLIAVHRQIVSLRHEISFRNAEALRRSGTFALLAISAAPIEPRCPGDCSSRVRQRSVVAPARAQLLLRQ